MYDDGADVVYAAAGASGSGVLEAASEAGEPGEVWTIGVDSDLYQQVDADLQPYVLTSMLKTVDVAVYNTIESEVNGTFAPGVETFRPQRRAASATRRRAASSTTYVPTIDGLKAADHRRHDRGARPRRRADHRRLNRCEGACSTGQAPSPFPGGRRRSARTAAHMTIVESERRAAPGESEPYAIELRDIVKRFPGVVANDGVDLKVRRGTIHAIVGENGAGKSTLMKTLYGAHQPDEGTIVVDGEEQHFRSPADAIAPGIGMVFQHFMLADNFTVWENIVLGSEPGWPVLARGAARRKIRELAEPLRPRRRPRRARRRPRRRREAAGRDPQGPLPRRRDPHPRRADRRARAPRGRRAVRLAARAHRQQGDGDLHLPQARRGARLRRRDHGDPRRPHGRRGRRPVVGHRRAARRDDGRQRAAVARDAGEHGHRPRPARGPRPHRRARRPAPGDVTLGITTSADLFTGAAGAAGAAHRPLDGVSFEVHAGEIVGIAGVEGNGQTELVEAIMGLVAATGTVLARRRRHQQAVDARPALARASGYIPEDRQRDGMVLAFPLWENVLLGHQGEPRSSSAA